MHVRSPGATSAPGWRRSITGILFGLAHTGSALAAVPDPARLPRLRAVPGALADRLAVSVHGAALAQQLAGARRQRAALERAARSSALMAGSLAVIAAVTLPLASHRLPRAPERKRPAGWTLPVAQLQRVLVRHVIYFRAMSGVACWPGYHLRRARRGDFGHLARRPRPPPAQPPRPARPPRPAAPHHDEPGVRELDADCLRRVHRRATAGHGARARRARHTGSSARSCPASRCTVRCRSAASSSRPTACASASRQAAARPVHREAKSPERGHGQGAGRPHARRRDAGRLQLPAAASPRSTAEPGFGSRGLFVELVQQRLAALHFYIPQTGRLRQGTGLAVDAYHRLLRRGTSSARQRRRSATCSTASARSRCAYPQPGQARRGRSDAAAAGADRQGQGPGDLPDQLRQAVDADDPRQLPGLLKTPGYLPDGMYYSNFFIRGYAIHGYDPAPDYPASHGCMRLPIQTRSRPSTG